MKNKSLNDDFIVIIPKTFFDIYFLVPYY